MGSFPMEKMCTRDILLCLWSVGGILGLQSSWPQPEFRGAWVVTLANIGWPSSRHLTTAEQKDELVSLLDKLKVANFNAVILQIRPTSDTFYQSTMEPWSTYLTGVQGVPPNPFYDPLEFAIAEAHARGMELHGWLNPYRARTISNNTEGLAPNHIAKRFPQYAYAYGRLLWMDPGAKPVIDFIHAVMMDIVRRYDIDGIHIDDYFYPYPLENTDIPEENKYVDFPDENTYQQYRKDGGLLSKADWRRENVDALVWNISRCIQHEKPHVKFGISPFGIWKDGHPPGVRGFSAFDEIYADSKKWLSEGWVDYLAPQLYWRIGEHHHSYETLLDWWLHQNSHFRHVYAGIAVSFVAKGKWKINDIVQQVNKSRSSRRELSLGNIHFRDIYINENSKGIADMFKEVLYRSPARVPPMNWKNNTRVKAPSTVTCKQGFVTWDRDNLEDVKNWVIYVHSVDVQNDSWAVVNVLGRQIRKYKMDKGGKYALTAVNRYDVESEPTYFANVGET
ncbi:hypothetical protein ScPMuIL_016198 [Solemya velum]